MHQQRGVDGRARTVLASVVYVPRAVRRAAGVFAAAMLLACVPSAQAAPKGVVNEFGGTGSGPGQFGTASPRGVAVNQASGDVYAVDGGNHRVERFSADGVFQSQIGGPGSGSGDGLFNNPFGVAIDPSDGAVWVTDTLNLRVQKFEPLDVFDMHAFDLTIGWGVQDGAAAFQVCQSSCRAGLSGAGDGQFGATFTGFPAVHPTTGQLYVADPGGTTNRRFQRFSASGAFELKFGSDGTGAGQFGSGGPSRVAVDSLGNVYAVDPANNRVQKCMPIAGPPETFSCAVFAAGQVSGFFPRAVAVDPATDHVYVARRATTASSEVLVVELDSSGALVETHAVGEGIGAGSAASINNSGLAVNSTTGDVYLPISAGAAAGRVFVLGDASPPDVTLDPVEDITPESATLHATINPNGALTRYRFEYSTDGTTWSRAPATDASAGRGTADVAVSQPIANLSPNTQYQVRVVADGFGPPITTPAETFTTAADAPVVASVGASPAATTATLRARINPRNSATTYRFEYGVDTTYGSVVPVPDGSVGSGLSLVEVSEAIAGLQPETTYHFRVVATNAGGVTTGTDRTFTTGPAVPQPPPGRGYEKVSPHDKNGHDVMADGGVAFPDAQNGSVSAATSGDAVVYGSTGAFAGSPSASTVSFYLGVRQPPAWSTTGISPPHQPGGLPTAEVEMISEDTSRAVVRTNVTLAGSPPPDLGIEKLYLRDTVSGTYQLLGYEGESFGSSPIFSANGSRDLHHILFETAAELTPDSVGVSGGKLYRWSNGELSLVSVLPDGTPVSGTAGNPGSDEPMDHAVSEDGSVVYFTAPPAGGGSERLYRREGTTTVLVSAEENDLADVPPGPATFRGATPDGRYVVFSSNQSLVEEDAGGSGDLYRYDAAAPAGSRLTLLTRDREPADGLGSEIPVGPGHRGGVLHLSPQGSRVYFVAPRQIVAGAPTAPQSKLYVWDESDGVRFIAGFPESDRLADQFRGVDDYRRLSDAPPAGERLLVATAGPPVGPDGQPVTAGDGGFQQVYLYDYGADEFTCVSCPTAGSAAGAADLYARSNIGGQYKLRGRRNFTDDGELAFFQTPTKLVPEDTNGQGDVYMWRDGALSLVSTGKSSSRSDFGDVTPDGSDIFFVTRERLVGSDTDNLRDLYNARIGGGLPDPAPPPPDCVGDECQGLPAAGPQLANPGSAQLVGQGDARPPVRPELSVRRLSRKDRARLARGLPVALRVRVNRAGRVSVSARARLGGRVHNVASDSARIRSAGTVRMRIRLSRPALRALARRNRLSVSMVVRFAGESERMTLRVASGRGR
jgi:NHL repeat-containing protein